jgi:hypothetical protein
MMASCIFCHAVYVRHIYTGALKFTPQATLKSYVKLLKLYNSYISDLEVDVEKNKYVLMYRDDNAEQNRDIKTGKRSFQNVSQFKYLGRRVTNQILIQ